MGQNLSPISVLVVEDEPMLLMMAAEVLKDAGFTVFEA
jgi:DNA-binding response OmpR family regulator